MIRPLAIRRSQAPQQQFSVREPSTLVQSVPTPLTPAYQMFSHPATKIARGGHPGVFRVIDDRPGATGAWICVLVSGHLDSSSRLPGMRQILLLAIRVLVSLALLYLALHGINFSGIQSRLSQINLAWIAVAVLVTILQIFLGALRWREISLLCDAPLADLQAFRY